MKKLFLILLFLSIGLFSKSVLSQEKQSYILTISENLDLSSFLTEEGYIDIERLKKSNELLNPENKSIQDFSKFIEIIEPISIRKFLRKLPYNVKFLKTKRGTEFSIEEMHKLHVVETYREINQDLINTHESIEEIIKNITTMVDEWPPNDPNYGAQIQFYSSIYNLNLSLAW